MLFIYLASVAEVWYAVKKDVSQKLAVGWMNYFEEGSLLLPISLLFTTQLWEGIRYLLCTHSTVELYKSNVVKTQWIYCAFADWLLCAYLCRNVGSGTQTWGKVGCQLNSNLPLKSCSRRILLFNILTYNIRQKIFLPMTECSERVLLLNPTDLLHCRCLAVSSSPSII